MWTTLRLLGGPQDQVVVLGAVEARPQAADALDQLTAINREVADVIVTGEGVRRPVGFEMRFQAQPLGVGGVLVGIEHVRFGVGVDGAGDLEQGERGQGVVVVQERHEVSGRQGERRRGIAGNPLVLPKDHDLDARLGAGRFFEDTPDSRRPAGAVRDAKLPVAVGLPANRLQQRRQERGRRFVGRRHDADLDLARKTGGPLRRQFVRTRLVLLDPAGVVAPGPEDVFSRQVMGEAPQPQRLVEQRHHHAAPPGRDGQQAVA